MRHLAVLDKLLDSISLAARPFRRTNCRDPRISRRRRLALALLAILAAQCAAVAQCNSAPTITALTPSSAKIYPPLYGSNADGDPYITCTATAPCTLGDMILQSFAFSWTGSNLCAEFTSLAGPLWWPGNDSINNANTGGTCATIVNLMDSEGYTTSTQAEIPGGGATVALGAGCNLTGIDPTMSPAKLGANLLTGVNNIKYEGNSLSFNLIGPYEMTVVQDYWQYYPGSTTNVERLTSYKVLNSDGTAAANIPIGEAPVLGSWNCTQAVPVPHAGSCTVAPKTTVKGVYSLGMSATNASGLFTDIWTLGGGSFTPAGCGWPAFHDQWQLCGMANAEDDWGDQSLDNYGLSFASPSGSVENNKVVIDVGTTSYVLPGTGVCGPDYLLCPDRLPTETIFPGPNPPVK